MKILRRIIKVVHSVWLVPYIVAGGAAFAALSMWENKTHCLLCLILAVLWLICGQMMEKK